MTEMNKDEALRCIDIAVQAYTEGKLDRAGKFLLKAEKLYPTEKAKYLLNKIKTQANTEATNTTTNTNTEKDANKENVKQRRNSGSRNTTEPEYTSEQIEAVRRLKKCTNYYEILGVSKTATDSEIKKAYKKLALLLHPDKNRAPGASEAFKAVGNAAGVLTDAEKRKQYDLYGINQPLNSNNANSNGSGMRSGYYTNEFGYTRGFQADVSAEELFNMFFGGGFTQQNVHMRAQRRRQQREEREGQISSTSLTNLLPILLLLGLSMISSFFISDPIYSLTSTAKYSVKRTTNVLKIPYYVKENFYSEYQGSVGRLEESVEEDYINHLKHTCSRERNYRDSLIAKARAFGERSLFDRAQNINMPACENLQKYIKT